MVDYTKFNEGFPSDSEVKNPQAMQGTWVQSLDQEDPWRRAWQLTPVFSPRQSNGQRSLAGCKPQSPKESDMTEAIQHAHTCTKCHSMIYKVWFMPDSILSSLHRKPITAYVIILMRQMRKIDMVSDQEDEMGTQLIQSFRGRGGIGFQIFGLQARSPSTEIYFLESLIPPHSEQHSQKEVLDSWFLIPQSPPCLLFSLFNN